MKRFILVIIFLSFGYPVLSQEVKKVECYPFPSGAASNGLGTISYTAHLGPRVGPYEAFGFSVKMGTAWKPSGEILRGFAKFDISGIPENATIERVKIHAECGMASRDPNHRIEIHQMEYDPDEIDILEYDQWLLGDKDEKARHKGIFDTIAKIFFDCGDGPLYTIGWDGVTNAGSVWRPLTPTAEKDLQAAISRGWFAVGLAEVGEDSPHGSLKNLNLRVSYTLPDPKDSAPRGKQQTKRDDKDEDVKPSWYVAYGKWKIDQPLPCPMSHESTASSPTGNQAFIWGPSRLDNYIINTSFIVNAKGSHSRIGIVANTEGGLGEDDRKWCLIIDEHGYLKLLEENVAHRANVPFHISLGERYKMRMFVNGNYVKGKIWRVGQNEPNWMVEDAFKGPYDKFGIGLQSEAAMTCFKEFYISKP